MMSMYWFLVVLPTQQFATLFQNEKHNNQQLNTTEQTFFVIRGYRCAMVDVGVLFGNAAQQQRGHYIVHALYVGK